MISLDDFRRENEAWARWAIQEAQDLEKIRHKAHEAFYKTYRKAIKDGILVRPDCCEDCDLPEKNIAGHHDDYTKPLSVRWLCRVCHGKQHVKELRLRFL